MTVKRRKTMKTLKLDECYINGDYYPLGAEVRFISGKFWFEGDNIYSLTRSGIIRTIDVEGEPTLYVSSSALVQGSECELF